MFRQKIDFYLLLPVFFLLGISVALMVSVSPENLGNHLVYIALSTVFFFFFSLIDIDLLLPFSPFFYLGGLVFLVLPFLLGTITRGSVRWIPIGGFTIQPSELVKPLMVLVSAWFWGKREFSFRGLGGYFLLFLPVLGLIFLQPDLGSTLVILSILAGSILVSNVNRRQMLVLILVGILIIPLAWLAMGNYQRARVIHFLNPYADPLGKGYNVIQAKIAVGSGGWWGRGLGRGTQSHLAFLPEKHTDFMFASLSEELGFAGAILVLTLYLFLFLRVLKIAALSQEKTFFLLAMGSFFYLFFQTMVNIGMNIGLLPITGITLPLVSYGGSSLLSTMITLGILENVSRQKKEERTIEIR